MADDDWFNIEKDENIYLGKDKKGSSDDTLGDNSIEIEEAMNRDEPRSIEEIANDFENDLESVTRQGRDIDHSEIVRNINSDVLDNLSETSDPQDLHRIGVTGWDTDLDSTSMFEGKLLDPLGFEAVVDAVNTAYWNPSELNNLTRNRGSDSGVYDRRDYGKILSSSWNPDLPEKMSTFRGQAGKLNVEEMEKQLVKANTRYDTADDAQPVSAMAHGALLHAAQILKNYGAETDGDEIKIENLSSREAEDVVQAYTFVDSLLESDDWDPRTVMKRIGYEPEESGEYNLDKGDYISDEL